MNPSAPHSPAGDRPDPQGTSDLFDLRGRSIVLVISSLRLGGAEKVLALIAHDLAAQGARVRVLTLDPPGTIPYYPLDAAIEHQALGLAAPSRNPLAALLANMRRIVRLRRALVVPATGDKPEVVLSFMGQTNLRVLLAAGGLGIPVVVSERSNPLRENLGFPWTRLRRLLYPRARFVVTPTARAGLAFRLPHAERLLRVIANPVPAAPSEETPRERTFVVMGRLVALKGYDHLLRAFQAIAHEVPGWSVRICGDGPEGAALRRLSAHLGIEARVHFEGTANPRHVLPRAGVFVLTSHYEGFPNVLCEAMACGTPVVAVDCEFGPREILAGGEHGILVPPADVGALSRALSRLARDAQAREEYGRRGARAMTQYAPEIIFPQWRRLLAEALNAKDTARVKTGGSLLVVAPSLRRGGAERAASWLSSAWAEDHRVSLAVFNGAERAYEHGGECVDLGLPAAPSLTRKLLNPVRRIVALRTLLRRLDPAEIFGFTESANFPLILAALSCGLHRRVTVSVHGNPRKMIFAHRLLIAILYGGAGRILCVSQGIAADLRARLLFGARRVEVHPNPLDLREVTRLAALPPSLPLDEPGPYFFAAGRLVPGKDFARLIRLFASARCGSARLVIAGEGPERPRLEALIASLGLSGGVILLGAVDNPFAWMRGALAFLMTSRHEGFPMVLIESMACSTPFVAFDCDFGPREAAPRAHAGWVIPMDDDAGFTAALERLAGDSSLRESLRAAARERAADFSLEKIAAAWLRSGETR